jgi:glycosyltransferase involved in cell wall biosynthesis
MQYLPTLKNAGLQITMQSLLSDDLLQARRKRGAYAFTKLLRAYADRCRVLLQRHQFDVVWIEKEALPWWPLWLERALLSRVPYVLDYDDAIFHNYDQHAYSWVRQVYGRRLDGLMANAALVVGGNQYLAQRARDAGAHRVEVLPTVIDLDRYPYRPKANALTPATDESQHIVWIGSPSTVRYLQLLREPLQALAERHSFVLRVIGGGAVDIPGVQVEVVPWAEDTEVENISACDVGVMPLLDSPWEQGKCGYKLIQYMACGLPVVASGVGVNSEIVKQGESGFLASTHDEWVHALKTLLTDAALRQRMGQAGRRKVERQYCLQITGPRMTALLVAAARA